MSIKKINLIKFQARLIASLSLLSCSATVWGWGFVAHKHINRCAVFTLPPTLFTFYKHYIGYITENAVNPDKRRYVVEGEAIKHYIDVDHYEGKFNSLPQRWEDAVQRHGVDSLNLHGIIPWHIHRMKHALTYAFRHKDVKQILRLSADIGHYIADANVPLHTSKNYNGQLTDQEGIHGLWETRLPELFKDDYDLLVGTASYIEEPQQKIWQAIMAAHSNVEEVLLFEKKLSKLFPAIQKYSFELRGVALKKVYSLAYAKAYHIMLKGQVEQQMRASIKMVGDFWYTCWADAGEPGLDDLLQVNVADEDLQEVFPEGQHLPIHGCGE